MDIQDGYNNYKTASCNLKLISLTISFYNNIGIKIKFWSRYVYMFNLNEKSKLSL